MKKHTQAVKHGMNTGSYPIVVSVFLGKLLLNSESSHYDSFITT